MQRSDMIDMSMSGNDDYRLARRLIQRGAENTKPHPGIDDEVCVPSLQMPDVGPEYLVDMRLVEHGQVIRDLPLSKPVPAPVRHAVLQRS